MSASRVRAPGRVNLIGDHTDYTGGLVLPIAVDRYVEVVGTAQDTEVVLTSDAFGEPARVPLDIERGAIEALEPAWARFVAGVVLELQPDAGFVGSVTSTVPVGSGLSSSAALELAVAVALGASIDDPVALAQLAQRVEHAARGVPTGIMDQLACAAGSAGHATLIDCSSLSITPVALPPDVEIVVYHSGQARDLAASAYTERVAQCAAAEQQVGPLRSATIDDVETIEDDVVRRRARHVVTENGRVRAAVDAISKGDLGAFGQAMNESHASLRDDYEVSTAAVDEIVTRLQETSDVLGARITGAGFGGCVVAIARPGAPLPDGGWPVRAVDGVHRS